MTDRRLLNYVKKSLDSGSSPDKIRSELFRAGWQKNDVEDAFSSAGAIPSNQPVQPANPPASRPKAGKSHRSIYLIGIVIAAIAGISVYYLVSSSLLQSGTAVPNQPAPDVCGDGNCTGQETYEICPQDCPAPPRNNDIRISVDPFSSAVATGQAVSFNITIASISDLYGFQFDVDYDPAVLQFSSASQGTFLNRNGADSVFCIDPKTSVSGGRNYLTIACTRLGPIGGVSGSGLLETVTFTATGSGTVQPSISNIKLVDSSAKRINF